MEETPLITFVKRADKTLNKIILPRQVIETLGREFIMKVYKDRIVLIPTYSDGIDNNIEGEETNE